jgi:hypothetical protein
VHLLVRSVVGKILHDELVNSVEGQALFRALSYRHHDERVVAERGLLVPLLLLQLRLLFRRKLFLVGLVVVAVGLLLFGLVVELLVVFNLCVVGVKNVFSSSPKLRQTALSCLFLESSFNLV